jgi:hypothetical protein
VRIISVFELQQLIRVESSQAPSLVILKLKFLVRQLKLVGEEICLIYVFKDALNALVNDVKFSFEPHNVLHHCVVLQHELALSKSVNELQNFGSLDGESRDANFQHIRIRAVFDQLKSRVVDFLKAVTDLFDIDVEL